MAARALAGNRSFRTDLALIVGAALVLRVLYTVLAARDLSGLGDYQFFQNVPNLVADGRGFTNPFLAAQGTFEPTALHPPLWPLLLSVSSALGGTSELAHKLVGTLAGTGTVALIGVLGRRIGGRTVGLTAAGLACVYPVFVGSDGSLMSESLYGLLIATVLLLALRLMDRPGPWPAAGLGVAIGLAALTRTEGLAFLVLLLLPAAWLAGGPLRYRAGLAAVAVAGALVVVMPWTIRNHEAFGSFVPVSTNEGTVLAGANCPSVYGGSRIGEWELSCVARVRSTNEGERAERWRRDGLDFMRDHAGRLPKVATARVLRTWGLFPPGKVVVNEGRPRWIAQVETVFYLVLLPLAVAGVFFLRGARERLVLLAPALIVTLVSAYGWGLTRFRHAADIALVVLAAVALVEIARRLAARRRVPSSAA
jgi:4-amino-4-deoxy-L-arabinose transferase-like glycosyltransferase